jgi:hypothetical protein
MLEEGVEKGFRALGRSVSANENIHVSVLKENREKQFEWLRKIGCGYIIKTVESVHPGTFQALIKKEIIAEEKEVPEFVETYRDRKLSIRRSSK